MCLIHCTLYYYILYINIRAVPRRRLDDDLSFRLRPSALHMRHAEPDSQSAFDERLSENMGGPCRRMWRVHVII